ncbi:MAG: hypothetical protein ACI8W8_001538 [Rhodothermales bacterium]|jgi:hypothetical protein
MNGLEAITDRRAFLSRTGLGSVALASLLNPQSFALQAVAPRAKRVISLFMSGGPSHVDLFDPKPLLTQRDGEAMPKSILKDHQFAMIKEANPRIKGSPWRFQKHGKSGVEISELLPQTAAVADELCVIRSVHTNTFNHGPAISFMTSGDARYGRPTMGAWLSYGLGSENEDLPAFVVLQSGVKRQPLLDSYWSSGFLPALHQGVLLREDGDPVLFLANAKSVSRADRRRQLDLIRWSNEQQFTVTGDPQIRSRIAAYELAFRMQTSVPELMDIRREPASMHALYGSDPGKPSFANNCLLARRLAEQGVRFIQLFDMGWDQHDNLLSEHLRQARGIDKPVAALLADLRQRGLLDETLVIWGGEFGRTPMAQGGGKTFGRDHHPHGFSMWMAGGGVTGGTTYGATDEFGYHAVEKRTTLYDLNATVLHLLGVDHKALTYRFQGRDFRLTDVHGEVVTEILV